MITGAAGFIGMHLSRELHVQGHDVIGIDNLQPSYGGGWSHKRKKVLEDQFGIEIHNIDLSSLANLERLRDLFNESDAVVHLAAWPGVRVSQIDPYNYSLANLTAFANVLEAVKLAKPNKFLFASSSSIYGDMGLGGPVKENSATGLNLKSYYAATKWSNEILANQYQNLTGIPTAALRFFTIYGDFGRPDMAYWTFLESILAGREVTLYGKDGGSRNFTHVSDASRIVSKVIDATFEGFLPLNITCGEPIATVQLLELLGKYSETNYTTRELARPDVDVEKTWADLERITNLIGHIQPTNREVAVEQFVNWYMSEVAK